MNFQTVSVAQKIRSTAADLIPDGHGGYTTSAPQPGGYQWVDGKLVPGPVLSSAFDSVDNQLVTVQDGPIVDAINAEWAKTHAGKTLIVAGTNDDLWQSYLSDNSQAAGDFVKSYLWNHTAQGFDVDKKPVTVQHSGLTHIWAGAQAAQFFGVPVNNGRYPDVFGKVQEGVVYAKPTKLAEHGGMNTGDQHVLMIVSGAGIRAQVVRTPVETTQVAPTILSLLGLDPGKLRAVQVEGTRVLPGAVRPTHP